MEHAATPAVPYLVHMRDIPEGPGRKFATLIRDARRGLGWTQEDLVEQSGISRSTLIRWEGGDVKSPDQDQVRKLCMTLGLDPREAVVALGYVTREEMQLPPAPPRIDPTLAKIARLLANKDIPDNVRALLRRHVKAALDIWLETHAVPSPKDPAEHSERRPVKQQR